MNLTLQIIGLKNKCGKEIIGKRNPQKAFIVSLNYRDSIKINNTEVIFLPYYELWNIN